MALLLRADLRRRHCSEADASVPAEPTSRLQTGESTSHQSARPAASTPPVAGSIPGGVPNKVSRPPWAGGGALAIRRGKRDALGAMADLGGGNAARRALGEPGLVDG